MSEELILPKKPTKAQLKNPSPLLIFGQPKIGKTTCIANLKNNLVLNFEDKVQSADGMVMYIDSLKKLKEVAQAIKKADKPYTYITIDTLTKVEEMCIMEAEKIYMRTPMGKDWIRRDENGKLMQSCGKGKYTSVLFLPNGSGYQYLRQAFKQVTNLIESLADNIIYIAHVKTTNILKDGAEISSHDINLIGKNKQTISADAQAIAFMTRINKKNYLSFLPSDDILAGCKIKRLEGKEILISEYDDEENLITYWDQIYIK
jgi:1,2-phenylacetyl-CoA epoxidase PaaB subunit